MKSFTILALLIMSITCQDTLDTTTSQSDLTKSQVWGFGMLTGFGISMMGFIAALILVGAKKCCKQIIFNNLIKFLFALAFGALIGDAIVHILAQAFANPDINGNIASAIFIASILIFIFIDRMLHAYGVAHTHWVQGQHGHTHNQHEHGHEQKNQNLQKNNKNLHNHQNQQQKHSDNNTCNINHNNVNKLTNNIQIDNIQNPQTNCNIKKQKCGAQLMAASDLLVNNENILQSVKQSNTQQIINNQKSSQESTQNLSLKQKIKNCILNLKGKQSKGYMNILGSFIHNFIDGLAIGVTFATGNKHQIIPVVIAVIAHQIPRELGDVAILLKSRFSGIQTILCNGTINFLSLFGVIAGLAAVNLNDVAQTYIMVSVAGNFIYIAADIWQNLFRNVGQGAKRQNLLEFFGAAVGIGAMFGIKFIQA